METQVPRKRTGAVGAFLDEYERAIGDLKAVLTTVTEAELLAVADPETEDENCRSIQTVMAHVVRAGYTYAIFIEGLRAPRKPMRERIYHTSVAPFLADLDTMFAYNVQVLSVMEDRELEVFDPAKKILSTWEQTYDPEQLLEHAIVHILRHRRQIERFLERLRARA